MRRISLPSLVCTVFMAAPAASSGQALPSDPQADSPSGVVYELPVDRARTDAAPRRETARSQTGAAGESSGTLSEGSNAVAGVNATSIRSENNFGTSSEVPGAPNPREKSAPGSAVRKVAGLTGMSPAASEGPSDGVVFPLLAALLAVGAAIGVVAGRRSLRDRRG